MIVDSHEQMYCTVIGNATPLVHVNKICAVTVRSSAKCIHLYGIKPFVHITSTSSQTKVLGIKLPKLFFLFPQYILCK